MQKGILSRWRTNFLTGLAVVLPATISIAVLIWLFGTVANITDTLLVFVPRRFTHQNGGEGPLFWYASVAAFVIAVLLICAVGVLARYYVGKRLIAWLDYFLLQVPLLNKIYAAIKQVNDAFSSTKKTAFRTVVMVEFPRPGMYSIGFITNDQMPAAQASTGKNVVCVFVPTTPNPTTGFLVLVEEHAVTKLDMSVAEGIKYIISLGSITPDVAPGTAAARGAEAPGLPPAPM